MKTKMHKLIAQMLTLTFLSACVSTVDSGPQVSGSTQEGITIGSKSGRLYNSSYYYAISGPHSDGSFGGSLQTSPSPLDDVYEIFCEINAMNNNRECYTRTSFFKRGTNDRVSEIFLYGPNPAIPIKLCLVNHDFPGKIARIKFDNDPPINLGVSGCTDSPSTIKKLFESEIVVVQSISWPYGNDTPIPLDLEGIEDFRVLAQHLNDNF